MPPAFELDLIVPLQFHSSSPPLMPSTLDCSFGGITPAAIPSMESCLLRVTCPYQMGGTTNKATHDNLINTFSDKTALI